MENQINEHKLVEFQPVLEKLKVTERCKARSEKDGIDL